MSVSLSLTSLQLPATAGLSQLAIHLASAVFSLSRNTRHDLRSKPLTSFLRLEIWPGATARERSQPGFKEFRRVFIC